MANHSNTQWITLGEIMGAHGVRGWLKVKSFTHPLDSLLDYPSLYLSENIEVAHEIEAGKPQGPGLILKLKGIESREAAEALYRTPLKVPADALPELEENDYYWSQLVGLSVKTTQGHLLGKVTSMLETGANDVLVVGGERGEQLIPYVWERVVLSVCLEKAEILVDWDPDF